MPLPMLPADKANHILYGAVMFMLVAYLATRLGMHGTHARTVGLLAAIALGLGKEARDWYANRKAAEADQAPAHNVDGMDALATAGGGCLCWLASMAVQG